MHRLATIVGRTFVQGFCTSLAMEADLLKFRSTRSRIAKVRPAPRAVPRRRSSTLRTTTTGTDSSARCRTTASADSVSDGENWDPNERDWSKGLCSGAHGRMRILFVGHNPSQRSWETTAPYAHKSNSFWKLLREAGFAPPELCEPHKFTLFPRKCSIGFADLFVTMGSVASDIKEPLDPLWRTKEFCPRIVAASGSLAPNVIACVSKSVAEKLLKGWKGGYGPVGSGAEWNLSGLEDSMIWVLPSSSGRAGMKWSDRLEPFQRLSRFVDETFPRPENVSVEVDPQNESASNTSS